jgi:hypothetical protein
VLAVLLGYVEDVDDAGYTRIRVSPAAKTAILRALDDSID